MQICAIQTTQASIYSQKLKQNSSSSLISASSPNCYPDVSFGAKTFGEKLKEWFQRLGQRISEAIEETPEEKFHRENMTAKEEADMVQNTREIDSGS